MEGGNEGKYRGFRLITSNLFRGVIRNENFIGKNWSVTNN